MKMTMEFDDQFLETLAEMVAKKIPATPQKMTLTTEEVASELNTYPAKISLWRREGLLPGIRSGNGWIFRRQTIESFLEIYEGCELGSQEKIERVKK